MLKLELPWAHQVIIETKEKRMKFSKIRDVKSPRRANAVDAGIDLFVPEDQPTITLQAQESCIIPAGVKFNVPEGYALVAFNKSGVANRDRRHS